MNEPLRGSSPSARSAPETPAAAPTSGHSDFGVTPNIHATEEEARDVAYLEALKRLNAANPNSDLAHERHRTIAILQKKLQRHDPPK